MKDTTAAIMALPAPLENIRLVGDEEKHATLLCFGETNTLPDGAKDILVESVKTACGMLFPFDESIRDVSRLGDENPPALVTMLSNRSLGQVRSLFLMNPSVKGYLDNMIQFPSFAPHITLAHPDFVDEVILRNLASQLYRVNFDRLAVWWNDERIECPLNPSFEGATVAMSEAIEKFLAHHGVKGQKWGVRRKTDTSTGLVARTDSADQIHTDRIAKKLKGGGTGALSNKDLQDFTTRINKEQEFNKALHSAEAQKGQSFITRFLKTQGKRQFNRVADKAIDLAVEKAIEQAGLQIVKKGHQELGTSLGVLSGRLKPKKK